MPVENLESPLLFLLVSVLVWIQLLNDSRCLEVVVSDRRILEDDRDAIVPTPVFRGVVPRLSSVQLENSPQFHLLLQDRVVILLEEGYEFVRMAPFRLVVILNNEWLL